MSGIYFVVLLFFFTSTLPQAHAAQATSKIEKKGTGTVAGQVSLYGEPLSGITVRIIPERMLASGDPRSPLQTVTNERGRYRITGVVAGNYYVSVLPDEFIITGPTVELQKKILSVSEGEKIENFDLVLKRGGVITGLVSDSSGEPLRRQAIELTRIGDDGKPQPHTFNHLGMNLTDEQGVYRLTRVPEGRYLVSAGISPERMGTLIPRETYFQQTFHPNVSDPSQARVVEVSEGAETTGIDILITEVRKTFDVKGRVVRAETGEPAEGIEVFYGTAREGDKIVGPRGGGERSNAEGEFHITGLLPGRYAIYSQPDADREYYSEPLFCEITDSGIDGLEVKLQTGGSISGSIVLEGTNDPTITAKLPQARIDGLNKNRPSIVVPRMPAKINADGSFRIAGLQPGKIYLSVSRPQTNAGGFSIKRIERDGAQVQDGIEIGSGEHLSNVRVIVGYGSLTLRGEVKVIGGTLPPHIGIYVNLNRISDSESGNTLGTFVDGRGQFIYQNLVPGDYEVRLISLNYQPGEPRDKPLVKLIYNTSQKLSLGSGDPPPVILVIDLSKKESDQ